MKGLLLVAAGFALGLLALSTLNLLADGPASQRGHSSIAAQETAVTGSPAHLLLVVRGLEVDSIPVGKFLHRLVKAPDPGASVEVELHLDTRIFGERGDQQTYQIDSRLVAIHNGQTMWSQVYAGELLSYRALRLQLDRAVGDAILYTRMAERSQLMVENRGHENWGQTEVFAPQNLSLTPICSLILI